MHNWIKKPNRDQECSKCRISIHYYNYNNDIYYTYYSKEDYIALGRNDPGCEEFQLYNLLK